MEIFTAKLDEVRRVIDAGETVEPVIIRHFLEWFDMYRRTRWNVDFIDRELLKRNLQTVPDYKDTWVDSPMTFAPISAEDQTNAEESSNKEPEKDLKTRFGEDPSYKIGKLRAAGNAPLFVAPTATLAEVTTKMFANGYSQMPVMQNYFSVKGVVTWKSIGLRSAHGFVGSLAKDYMDPAVIVESSNSIFDAIRQIVLNDYVLVRNPSSNEIVGIVTASDLCEQFEEISKPFLLISEIEINIRTLIENTFHADSLKEFFARSSFHQGPDGEIKSAKLNFSDYIMILRDEAHWQKIGLRLDKVSFCEDLEKVRAIRNDIMHFASDPMQLHDLEKIAGIARMLDMLRAFC